MNKPLTVKQLAAALPCGDRGRPRSRGYVHAMRKAGFHGKTLREALAWLTRHPSFTWGSVYNPKETRRKSQISLGESQNGKTLTRLPVI